MTRFSNAQPGLLLIPARIKDLLLILTRIKDLLIWSSNDQIQPDLLPIPARIKDLLLILTRIKDSIIWSLDDQISESLILAGIGSKIWPKTRNYLNFGQILYCIKKFFLTFLVIRWHKTYISVILASWFIGERAARSYKIALFD